MDILRSVLSSGSYIVLTGRKRQGLLEVLVSLPDSQKGRYRGTRFAWTPMIGRVQWQGHTFFGEWKKGAPDPLSHDGGAFGTAEEFDMDGPATFSSTPAGGVFVKPGVGLLRKPDDTLPYQFYRKYELVQPADRRIQRGDTWVEVQQSLQTDTAMGKYGYLYRHRITLLPNEAAIQITRTLTNTGVIPWETEHYSHNFLRIDDDPIGPAYRLWATVPLQAEDPVALEKVGCLWQGQTGTFTRPMTDSTPAFAIFQGTRLTLPTSCHFALRNLRTRAGISLVGTGRQNGLASVHFYATERAICPEPFTHLIIPPGKTVSWADTYTLSVQGTNKK